LNEKTIEIRQKKRKRDIIIKGFFFKEDRKLFSTLILTLEVTSEDYNRLNRIEVDKNKINTKIFLSKKRSKREEFSKSERMFSCNSIVQEYAEIDRKKKESKVEVSSDYNRIVLEKEILCSSVSEAFLKGISQADISRVSRLRGDKSTTLEALINNNLNNSKLKMIDLSVCEGIDGLGLINLIDKVGAEKGGTEDFIEDLNFTYNYKVLQGRSTSIEIDSKDYGTLKGTSYVNDKIIMFYLK